MQRALVIKVHGDKAIGNAIVNGMESKELSELRAKVGVMRYKNSKECRERMRIIREECPIKEHSVRYNKFWGYVGLVWLIITHGIE